MAEVFVDLVTKPVLWHLVFFFLDLVTEVLVPLLKGAAENEYMDDEEPAAATALEASGAGVMEGAAEPASAEPEADEGAAAPLSAGDVVAAAPLSAGADEAAAAPLSAGADEAAAAPLSAGADEAAAAPLSAEAAAVTVTVTAAWVTVTVETAGHTGAELAAMGWLATSDDEGATFAELRAATAAVSAGLMADTVMVCSWVEVDWMVVVASEDDAGADPPLPATLPPAASALAEAEG